jgi:hypothetical protein
MRRDHQEATTQVPEGEAMEEDVLGPRQTLGRRYTTCTRCGQVLPRRIAQAQEAGVMEGAHSAVADLCPTCQKESLTEPVPVDTDE